ncbi:MAG: hypothetical protein P8182_19915 [Deltaproteobacteria bacterium]
MHHAVVEVRVLGLVEKAHSYHIVGAVRVLVVGEELEKLRVPGDCLIVFLILEIGVRDPLVDFGHLLEIGVRRLEAVIQMCSPGVISLLEPLLRGLVQLLG